MKINYMEYAKIFKVFSDPKRLKIIDMLSEGELCACKIQEAFQISQPTLSHDMKLLCDAGLVLPRKEGKWTHYSLNLEKLNDVYKTLGKLIIPEDFQGVLDCNCEKKKTDTKGDGDGR
ncbi:transcriptional regulator [Drancourtella sp. An210]|uniref:ArsR/SmtB family transcription factor n=1 Tax=Sellimonas sp. TaxID=2021466 RepID=UPI000B3790EC|nr:transcriptional regulator [Drancourtella sp. An210]